MITPVLMSVTQSLSSKWSVITRRFALFCRAVCHAHSRPLRQLEKTMSRKLQPSGHILLLSFPH